MGNEIFYCTRCGVRTSGSNFVPGTSGFGAEQSCCPACLGLPVVNRRESSKKIRKPSSATVTAVAPRPRLIEPAPVKRSMVPIVAAAILVAAGGASILLYSPNPALKESPPAAQAIIPLPPPAPAVRQEPPTPPPTPQPAPAPAPVKPDFEALADAAYDEIQEAASALADEGRVGDALAQIRKFPAEYRGTRAWNHLEGLRRRIEQRAR